MHHKPKFLRVTLLQEPLDMEHGDVNIDFSVAIVEEGKTIPTALISSERVLSEPCLCVLVPPCLRAWSASYFRGKRGAFSKLISLATGS